MRGRGWIIGLCFVLGLLGAACSKGENDSKNDSEEATISRMESDFESEPEESLIMEECESAEKTEESVSASVEESAGSSAESETDSEADLTIESESAEESPESETSDSPYDQIVSEAHVELLCERIVFYINEFRTVPAIRLQGKAQDYAMVRSQQLVAKDNFDYDAAHDMADVKAAAAAVGFGEWRDATLYGDPPENSYYSVHGSDAVVDFGTCADTVEGMASAIALSLYNSPAHWAYVGEETYIAVGIACHEGIWRCCVFMTPTDEYD